MSPEVEKRLNQAVVEMEAARHNIRQAMELLAKEDPTEHPVALWEEARTIYQDIGKTPRQLLEENQQLRQQLTKQ